MTSETIEAVDRRISELDHVAHALEGLREKALRHLAETQGRIDETRLRLSHLLQDRQKLILVEESIQRNTPENHASENHASENHTNTKGNCHV